MDRIFELGTLLDTYGELLTDRQRSVAEQYADENLSLAEIAEREGVTRQAVRDILIRAEGTLKDYEKGLHLARKLEAYRSILTSMERRFHDVELMPADRDSFDGYLVTLRELWED